MESAQWMALFNSRLVQKPRHRLKQGFLPHSDILLSKFRLNLLFLFSNNNYGFYLYKREYIELEIQLREFDRCRKLYAKFLEYAPENCTTWIKEHWSSILD